MRSLPEASREEPLSVTEIVTAGLANVRFWVKSRHVQRKSACPLYPQKQTCAVH